MTRAHDGKLLYRSPATVELLGEVKSAIDYYVEPNDRRRYVERLIERRQGRRLRDPAEAARRRHLLVLDFLAADRLPRRSGDRVAHLRPHRPHGHAAGAGATARDVAPEREAVGAGRAAGRGRPRAQQPPIGRARPVADAHGDRRRAKTVERAAKISKAAERCARIVKTFLAMARQQPTRSSNVAIEDVILQRRRGGRLRHPLVGRRAFHLAAAGAAADLGRSRSAEPGADQSSGQCRAGAAWLGRAAQDRVSARRDTRTGQVVVRVGDTGPGIPKDILPRIFEPFFTTKEVGSGTGIGLSFCHRIVQSHGGTITVETGDGRGSTFVVSLPVSATADIDDAAEHHEPVAERRPVLPGGGRREGGRRPGGRGARP